VYTRRVAIAGNGCAQVAELLSRVLPTGLAELVLAVGRTSVREQNLAEPQTRQSNKTLLFL